MHRVLFDKIPENVLSIWMPALLEWAKSGGRLGFETTIRCEPINAQWLNAANEAPQTYKLARIHKIELRGGWDQLDRYWLIEPVTREDEELLTKYGHDLTQQAQRLPKRRR